MSLDGEGGREGGREGREGGEGGREGGRPHEWPGSVGSLGT